MTGFDRPVSLKDGKVGYWKQKHPDDVESRDEYGHVVLARATRLWVTDKEGKSTKKGHNKRKYYCVTCAYDLGAGDPPRRYF